MRVLIYSFTVGLFAVLGAAAAEADVRGDRSADRQSSEQVSRYRRSVETRRPHHDRRGARHNRNSRYDDHAVSHRDHRRHRAHKHGRNRHYSHDRHYDDYTHYRRHYRQERRYRRALRRSWYRAHRHHHYGEYCPFAGTSYPYYDTYLSAWILVPWRRH